MKITLQVGLLSSFTKSISREGSRGHLYSLALLLRGAKAGRFYPLLQGFGIYKNFTQARQMAFKPSDLNLK